MACQWCEWGDAHSVSKRVQNAQGVFIHTSPKGEPLTCEDQPARAYEKLPESEKKKLILIAEVASIIRMDHAVDLYKAIDWAGAIVRSEGTGPARHLSTRALHYFGHTCDRTCSEAKKVE